MADAPAAHADAPRGPERVAELRKEAFTMALYVAICCWRR